VAKKQMNKRAQDIINAVKSDSFLKNQVMVYGEGPIGKCPRIPFNFYALDDIFDGGIPKGRIIEFFGPESGGKTTLSLHAIAACQAAGGVCCFIDVENAFDPWYAKQIGVKVEEIILAQPDHGEATFDIANRMVELGVDVTIVDSVAAMITKDELEKELEQSERIGCNAKMMSRGMRKLVGTYNKLKNKESIVIFINQIREKIGVMYGSPETTPGGRALKFAASMRVDVRRLSEVKEETINNEKVIIAKKSRIKIVKSKVCRPFVTCDLWLDCSVKPVGFRKDLDLINNALKEKIINNIQYENGEPVERGRTYFFVRVDGQRIKVGTSMGEVEKKILENKEFFNEINEILSLEENPKPTQETIDNPISFDDVFGDKEKSKNTKEISELVKKDVVKKIVEF